MHSISNGESDRKLRRVLDTTSLSTREVKERFVRAAGPDGQNVRHEATAVELRVNLYKSAMPLEVRERLIALAGRQVTRTGELVVVSRGFRSQSENRDAARGRLAELLALAAKPPTIRKGRGPAGKNPPRPEVSRDR